MQSALILLTTLLAQANPPVVIPRETAEPTFADSFDFDAQVKAMQGVRPVVVPPPSASSPPKDFVPRTDVPLTATALEAVRVSERWRAESNAPAAGPDGKVLYSFGAGLPTIVCAPLRVCMIELQAGERLVGEPHVGDAVRWNISPAAYGTGDDSTSVIVLKPQQAGLDTNLVITTDRRAYYLRLISKSTEYVARAAFAYPADEARKWQQVLAAQKARESQPRRAAEVLPAVITIEKMNFAYSVKGGEESLRPVRVFDDGAKTYLQMRPDIQHREAPALLVVGANGMAEMVNYRVQNQVYIVDRLFDRARLILGAGKKSQKVEIIRARQG